MIWTLKENKALVYQLFLKVTVQSQIFNRTTFQIVFKIPSTLNTIKLRDSLITLERVSKKVFKENTSRISLTFLKLVSIHTNKTRLSPWNKSDTKMKHFLNNPKLWRWNRKDNKKKNRNPDSLRQYIFRMHLTKA